MTLQLKIKSKCTEEFATLFVLQINLSPGDFEMNVVPDIPQIYHSKVKTITPNFVPVKKNGLHEKCDQITVTVSPVVRVPVELQHPSHLSKLEDADVRGKKAPRILADQLLKLTRSLRKESATDSLLSNLPTDWIPLSAANAKIATVSQGLAASHQYIVAGTEELHLEICTEDLKEDNAFTPLKKTNAVAVVPESVRIEVKRSTPEKRRNYFISKLRQKKFRLAIVNH
ncbi:hypothetical protein TNCV_920651 [Trichonephila clavipes]|nr:hypothetical protein TNCV_920651 [Trichonephila clavipes]